MAERILVQHDKVEEFLDLHDISGHDSNRLQLLNSLISNAAEEKLKWTVLAKDFAEVYDGTGDDELILFNYPVISVASVIDDDDVTLVSGTDYRILANSGILKMINGIWVKEDAYYTTIYRAGYESDDIPSSIKMAVYMWIGEVFNKIKSKSFGVVSNVKFGEEVVNYLNDGPSQAVEKLLKPYQRSQVVTTRN